MDTFFRVETETMTFSSHIALVATCVATNVASSGALVNHVRATLPLKIVGAASYLQADVGRQACPVFGHQSVPTAASHDLDLFTISSRLFQCNATAYGAFASALKNDTGDTSTLTSEFRAIVKLVPNPISRPDGSRATVLLSRSGGFAPSVRSLTEPSLCMLSFEASEKQPRLLQQGVYDETSLESLLKACLTEYDLSVHCLFHGFPVNIRDSANDGFSNSITACRIDNDRDLIYSTRTKDAPGGRDFQESLIFEDTNLGGARIFHSTFQLLNRSSLPEDLREHKVFKFLNENGKRRVFLATP
jgi:hypothetical protein